MAEKINLSLFEDFFESSSPADYAKELINTKNPIENKKIAAEIKNKISDLKDRIKKMSETENKNADETLKIIEEILDCNKNAQKILLLASKVGKGKPVSKKTIVETNIEESVKLRRRGIAEIEEEEKNIKNELFKKYCTDYQTPSDMYKTLRETEGKRK